ncbi:NADH:flavorubredoxin reductase NorW [Photobacterium sp. BZF1]|uniref:NADH:flavorubredoxin reductase NorW n=1 Tax=Photobacterium sp. BZF1 TaxID=1904457 RepID=UPI0016537E08|nr:NADH:flavorubredoxin reductase NorW [Photobacterium sp. BZF1]MBC7001039.1 NADH:flavorubredoxin reductase NorW [Photobacterium sp. BZF1]
MAYPIIIIGSGFAALQTVKMLRRTGCTESIELFTAGNGCEYSKPDLSHVFSKDQWPEELASSTARELEEEHGIKVHTNTYVQNINHEAHTIKANDQFYTYSKLVIATGASTFVPPIKGIDESIVATLNSLEEFKANKLKIDEADHVSVIGGGLIGVELALDLAKVGKKVTIIEPSSHLLSSLIPDFVAAELQKSLSEFDIKVLTNSLVEKALSNGNGTMLFTNQDVAVYSDVVLSAAGVRPNISLATESGIATNQGIVVNEEMKTSAPDVFAIGDCAEINGRVLAFLQPAVMSASVIANQIGGGSSTLRLPNMMVKVKTPEYPIQLAGNSVQGAAKWTADIQVGGMLVKSYDKEDKLTGFICTGEQASQAFPMLRELNTANN